MMLVGNPSEVMINGRKRKRYLWTLPSEEGTPVTLALYRHLLSSQVLSTVLFHHSSALISLTPSFILFNTISSLFNHHIYSFLFHSHHYLRHASSRTPLRSISAFPSYLRGRRGPLQKPPERDCQRHAPNPLNTELDSSSQWDQCSLDGEKNCLHTVADC